jgi:hypothetical protein
MTCYGDSFTYFLLFLWASTTVTRVVLPILGFYAFTLPCALHGLLQTEISSVFHSLFVPSQFVCILRHKRAVAEACASIVRCFQRSSVTRLPSWRMGDIGQMLRVFRMSISRGRMWPLILVEQVCRAVRCRLQVAGDAQTRLRVFWPIVDYVHSASRYSHARQTNVNISTGRLP